MPILVGDAAAGCAGNKFAGDVVLTANLAVTFGGNAVSRNVTIDSNGPGATVIKATTVVLTPAGSRNNPAPVNAGQANAAGAKTGQYSSL